MNILRNQYSGPHFPVLITRVNKTLSHYIHLAIYTTDEEQYAQNAHSKENNEKMKKPKMDSEDYETPWKDSLSRRVSKIDEAAAFCAKVNFNLPSNSPSFA
jgi:hypothetical protein